MLLVLSSNEKSEHAIISLLVLLVLLLLLLLLQLHWLRLRIDYNILS